MAKTFLSKRRLSKSLQANNNKIEIFEYNSLIQIVSLEKIFFLLALLLLYHKVKQIELLDLMQKIHR